MNKPNAHTQGPWLVKVSGSQVYIENTGGRLIAKLAEGAKRDANAHLLASAPDLLQALEGMLLHYHILNNGLEFKDAWAAVNKARGQT